MSVFFISGVDTDAGKTFVTARLAAQLSESGVNVMTQKPVQTGCTDEAEDIVEHRKVMGTGMTQSDKEGLTCTYLFKKPASPALAASLEGKEIDLSKIDSDTAELARRHDVVLVEGAGGLMVPMTQSVLTIDYVASRKLPMILVTTSHLGGINHALLSIEACKNHGVDLRHVVFNRFPSDDPILADDAKEVIEASTKKEFPQARFWDFRGRFDGDVSKML